MDEYKYLINYLKAKYCDEVEVVSDSEVKLRGKAVFDKELKKYLGEIQIILTNDEFRYSLFTNNATNTNECYVHLVDFKFSQGDNYIDVVYNNNILWANDEYENCSRLIKYEYTPIKVYHTNWRKQYDDNN